MRSFSAKGIVAKNPYDKFDLPRKATKVVKFIVLQLVLQRPGILLSDINSEVSPVLRLKLSQMS